MITVNAVKHVNLALSGDETMLSLLRCFDSS